MVAENAYALQSWEKYYFFKTRHYYTQTLGTNVGLYVASYTGPQYS